ncbi:MAG: GTP cyclohydrolase I FolE [bacterium]|nr:GTP cyclohydrolase I FolE [bacterium]
MQELEGLYKQIIENIGEDINREGLVRTPARAAEAVKFLTRGYEENIENVLNGAVFDSDMDEMVIVQDIELYSLCEHHFLPFFGKCHVAYIPKGKIIGLSKIARMVDVFARRLQVQENLTMQIANAVLSKTGAEGVGVVIEARHLCTMMRGVQKQNSMMKTSCMLGSFRDDQATRAEFLSLIRN